MDNWYKETIIYHKLLIYFCKNLYCETTNYFTSHVDIKNFTNLSVLKIIFMF